MSRNQRSLAGPGTRITKSLGSLIGLGSEAYAHHKEKKAAAAQENQVTSTAPEDDASYSDQEPDEEDWALDTASSELSSTLDEPFSAPEAVSAPPTTIQPLPYPVILPQRRPQTKSRGFVRAYAPLLGSCKGISEATFLKFLEEFYKESQASDYWQVLNVAALAVGNVPSLIAMGVSMSCGAAAKVGIETQTRQRTNVYLDKVNEDLFHPLNLHVMIMTYKPEQSQNPFVTIDVHAHDAALAKSLERHANPGAMGKIQNPTAGTVRAEFVIPQSAPLVYPVIDKAAAQATSTAEGRGGTAAATADAGPAKKEKEKEKPSAMKRSTAFVQDYLDRRAHAEYAGVHGADSKLAVPGATTQQNWASRFADPNHPANSGSIAALLTGGKIDPRSRVKIQRAELRAGVRQGRSALSEQEREDVRMRRGPGSGTRGPLRKGVKKMLGEHVLYLVVAEMPSVEEREGMVMDD